VGLLARMMREALSVHVTHRRRCASCSGTGWKPSILRAPGGVIPPTKVVAKIQCDECSGKGEKVLYEQHIEKGRDRVWDQARLIHDRVR
jgi:DnaJ-class molecular chaperone